MPHPRNLRAVAAGATVFAAAALFGTAALARPQLLSSSPADDAEVAPASRLELTFSETLQVRRSAARLTMTAMPGMDSHPPMGMAATVAAGENPATMVITTDQPLPRGSYRIDWRAVSPDSQQATGSVNFRVK